MTANKSFYIIYVILITSILFSCEGSTDIYRNIKNDTSSTITVKGSILDNNNYNKTIEPGKTELLYLGGYGMGASSEVEDPALRIDSLIITNVNIDTCLKDFRIQSNWDIDVKQTKKRPSTYRHEYTFIVRDSDF